MFWTEHSRVDKSTVNVKLIAGCYGHISFKRKRWTVPALSRRRGYWQVRFLESISNPYKASETSFFWALKSEYGHFLNQKLMIQKKKKTLLQVFNSRPKILDETEWMAHVTEKVVYDCNWMLTVTITHQVCSGTHTNTCSGSRAVLFSSLCQKRQICNSRAVCW